MSIPFKQLFRRMNLDSDVRSLRPGEHRKLTNGISVQPASSTGSLQDIITSFFGNAVVANADLAGGTNKVVGFLEDQASNRAFFCIYNSTAANHTVYQYKDGVVSRVLRTALWGFSSTDYVDMDISGDLLFLTNNNSDIKQINVVKAIAGATYTPAVDEITLIKRPPRGVLTWAMVYDISYANNYVSGNYFQFFHRYVYEDNQRSVFGGASKSSDGWALPTTTVDVAGLTGTNYSLAAEQTIDNVLTAGSRVLLKNQTDPKENGIWVTAGGAWSRAVDADTSVEILALNVYVKQGRQGSGTTWKNTNAAAITIGADNITFTPILGPNAIDVTVSTADFPATVRQIEYAVKINGAPDFFVYRVDKTPLGGATHRFYNNTFLYTVPSTAVSKWSDAVPLKSKALRLIEKRLFLFRNTENYTHSTTTSVTLTATPIAFTDTRSFRHFKDGGTYNVGLVFFDLNGRFVGGVHCDASITIPYRDNPFPDVVGTPPYGITVDLTGIAQADIPLDAMDYAVLVTNLTDKSYFIRYLMSDFFYYIKDADGAYTYTKTYGGNVTGTAIDITTLAFEGIGYTFNAGDRIRINGASSFSADAYIYVDTEIIGQEGRFILTRPINEFSAVLFAGAQNPFLFEIYTPKSGTVEPFFEVGEKFAISNPGGGSRAFSTTSVTPTGDVSSVLRSTYGTSGSYSPTAPFTNTYTKNKSVRYPFEAMNSYDKSFSQWIKPGAKSTIKSKYDAVQSVKTTALRFGQAYDQNSQAVTLNEFEALNEQILPIESGPGTGLAIAGKVLVGVQEVGTTSVYVGEGFVNTSNQNNFLAKTDSVIGDIQKNLARHGSVHQASIVAREGAVYYLDSRKGCVIRRSQDGLTVISEYGKDGGGIQGLVSALCTAHVALGANSRIIGGWDPQYACYVLSFIDTTGPSGYTLYWHEKTNGWVARNDMRPELWGLLGQNQLAFLAGAIWSQTVEANYNKFFGVQYNRRLEWEIAPEPSLEKIWEAIEVDAESIYSTAGTNEDVVLLYHVDGGVLQNRINYLDFIRKKSAWRSSVFRNLNDASMSSTTESKYKSSHNTRGQSAFLVITYNGTDKNPMKSITTFFRPSLNSTP